MMSFKSGFFVDTLSYFEYIEGHSNHTGSADMARTQDLLKLNEEAIKRLPLPEKGNRITYFPGAVLQGTQVPRGFGVRVTASGSKSFIINYPIKRAFDQLVKPSIGKIGIYELCRSDVAQMLDEVADERGLVMADKTLAWLRKAFNWYAGKDDKFNSPIVKGMARTKPRERARTRVLSDDELRV